ncbi:ligase-associated DNA damage response DEXH box helicase [Paraburkholderia phymatum]|uniref:DEAD/H associated domain protein n=1 Tax=Paraburkholderia phymatum (strain DSM 17167 / CIP 108236 / LMG 21445 / STM815) TaxID=391038 RepID=B2JT69_PARP8|nr:ligase-associated DNA damage response DEXH box helicase [Paraburkholderia phymatum]ACC75772.1 DEAD/H associated domain protein [Paraburkholderia phymatum STM815]
MTDPIDPERNNRRAGTAIGKDCDADPPDASAVDDTLSGAPRRRVPRPRPIPKARAPQTPEAFTSAAYAPEPDKAGIPFAARVQQWFDARQWQPFEFQRDVWRALAEGLSGLLHATTGAGKTWAVWFGAMSAYGDHAPGALADPLTVLWITPMRALAADTARALQSSARELAVPWTIGLRTGDTNSTERARQSRRMPSALVTTPESLSLMLTRSDARDALKHVRLVVVDEWHELLGNKRGTQAQLAIAHLARWRADLQVWGLSATLGNLDFAADVLLAPVRTPRLSVSGMQPKTLLIDTLIPATIERFPWGGHLGTRQVDAVAAGIDEALTSLVFTNTRSQAEIWYQALLALRPDWAGLIALHHGSLAQEVREWVEDGLKNGKLKAVVCTSSLDLGVDFLPVERVFQIGSPKGVARLMQRAGRSGHAPGRASRITIVPTHALELVEAAAARRAVEARRIEGRETPRKPFDVLVQHLVTVAIGGGFDATELFDEVRTTFAYRDLTRHEFDWALAFVERGGPSLGAYPDFHRVVQDEDGVYRVPRDDLIRRHRNNVGTIVANATLHVAWLAGGRIGSMEESFISRLKPGDVFTFGGRALELVRVRDMTAYVRRASSVRGAMPQWAGSKMPLSSELADATLAMLAEAVRGIYSEPEMIAVRPLLELQASWSALPEAGVLVAEMLRSREGHHFFCYPFAGRVAHIGLASLLGWRAARERPGTFSISANDYGFELLSSQPFDWAALIAEGLFSSARLAGDIMDSLNASELAMRRFREIARVAGLVYQAHPGQQKSARQLQASSGLFYEVFRKHDSDNLLLAQADAEVMLQELELDRMKRALDAMNTSRLALTHPKKPTPFAFPLIVARIREKVSTEKLADRIERMLAELDKAAC